VEQFVTNPIKGQGDFLDAFHTISEIIHRFAVVETLPQISVNESVLKETAIKLYRLIMVFQAKALIHLKRHTIHRVWNDTIDPNQWSSLLQGIKDQEVICNGTLTQDSSVAIVRLSREVGGIQRGLQKSIKNQMDAVKVGFPKLLQSFQRSRGLTVAYRSFRARWLKFKTNKLSTRSSPIAQMERSTALTSHDALKIQDWRSDLRFFHGPQAIRLTMSVSTGSQEWRERASLPLQALLLTIAKSKATSLSASFSPEIRQVETRPIAWFRRSPDN
jgi:NWD NACHT NTPase-like protein